MEIKAKVKSTEDPEKLKEAILNVLSGSELNLNKEESIIKGESSFKVLWERATEQRIRDSILDILKNNERKGETYIDISKTAASSGKLATDVGSSLGEIHLTVPWKKVEKATENFDSERTKELNR